MTSSLTPPAGAPPEIEALAFVEAGRIGYAPGSYERLAFINGARFGYAAGRAASDEAIKQRIGELESQPEAIRKLFVEYDVRGYVDGYEFRSDEGDHTPTADEAALLEDAIQGVLSDLHGKVLVAYAAGRAAQAGAPFDFEKLAKEIIDAGLPSPRPLYEFVAAFGKQMHAAGRAAADEAAWFQRYVDANEARIEASVALAKAVKDKDHALTELAKARQLLERELRQRVVPLTNRPRERGIIEAFVARHAARREGENNG